MKSSLILVGLKVGENSRVRPDGGEIAVDEDEHSFAGNAHLQLKCWRKRSSISCFVSLLGAFHQASRILPNCLEQATG